ncbi:molybdenum cofactor guanylyltransferase [Schlesneria paludicola]|uniref:molybdenum cofactor guanylyltransferase n=1 Tax=Schlesneria paludicola TaxID=360056 RepID=UPI00029B4EAA|nr:molybdenum cofactor guanylyltransferase [Schlesneria paludicola]
MQQGSIILCGGLSTRMGRDKATLPFGPELMLQRVVRLVSERINPRLVVVVAAANQQLPVLPANVTVAFDSQPKRGPLEGLATGLRAMPQDVHAVYATSCDTPLLKSDFIERMFTCLNTYDIAVPADGTHDHPLAAVYRPRVLSAIERLINSGRLKARLLFDEVPTRKVSTEELREVDPTLQTLMNVNHVEDYLSALALAGFAGSYSED